LVQPFVNPGVVAVRVYDGNDCTCADLVGYEIDTLWSPVITQPLVTTALGKANTLWQCIEPYFAECDDAEVLAMMERVQTQMQLAASIGNPIAASGALSQALEIMDELAVRLTCPCAIQ
jgi:hypothetical protein